MIKMNSDKDALKILCPLEMDIDDNALYYIVSGECRYLLKVNYVFKNNKHMFVYAANADSVLRHSIINMSFDELLQLLSDYCAAVKYLKERWLDVNKIRLDIDYIFKGKDCFQFVYLPIEGGKSIVLKKAVKDLLSYVPTKDDPMRMFLNDIRKLKNNTMFLEYCMNFVSQHQQQSLSKQVEETTILSDVCGETTILLQGDEETTILSQCDEETTVLSPCDEETTVLSPCDEETTVLSPCDEETTVLSPCDEETTILSQCDEETTVLSPCDEETVILSSCDEETTILSQCDEETTVLSPCDEETTVLSPCDEETTVLSAVSNNVDMYEAWKGEKTTQLLHNEFSESETTLFSEQPPAAEHNTFQENKSGEGQSVLSIINNHTGDRIVVNKNVFTIGKDRQNMDYFVPSSSISKTHAIIICEQGVYYIMDNKSTNGTMIEGVMLQPYERAELYDGSLVTIGNVGLQIKIERR